jgi:hypothetical protein
MKMDPAEIEWSGMDWIDLTQDRVCWTFRFHNMLENAGVTTQVAPSRERLGSTELVQYSLRYVETGVQEIFFLLLYVAFVLYPLRQEVYAILKFEISYENRNVWCERGVALSLSFFVWSWSEFLATDPEARVQFPALPGKKSSGSGTGSTQPHVYNWKATW